MRAELTAVGVLVVLPVLIFAVPAFFGHTAVPGDDFTQNYPLRAFVGSQIRHGHVPLYDPYIWSGAPLLGGWNAGAAYPLTLLFVVMPATAAWTLNLLATSWVASLGSFAFLRSSRLSPLPSFLGAFSFSFGGAMTAQVVHFGLVAGVSWIPLALLALLRLSSPPGPREDEDPSSAPTETTGRRSRAGWCALLAVTGAMIILAGEPRAITTAVVIIGIYMLWRVLRLGRRSLGFLALSSSSLLLAAGLGTVQWLPGIEAVHTSQRAVNSSYLFTSGSLPLKWLLLFVVPDLLGGSGSFGQPPFLASYSLTEVSGYIGLMPLVASFALLARLRLRRPLPEWVVWELVALVGVLLTLGNSTPLWHLFIHLPFFGSQRLQSRNILVADMGFSFLLAYWAESWGAASRTATEPSAPAPAATWTLSTVLGVLPGLVAVGTVLVGLAWGAGMLHWLGATLRASTEAGGLRWWFVPFAVLGLGSVALLVQGPRLSRRRRLQLLTSFVVVDLVAYSMLVVVAVGVGFGRSSPPPVTQVASGRTTSTVSPQAGQQSESANVTKLPAGQFTGGARFAIYDPDLLDGNGLDVIGAPDLNVVDAVPSVQGYGSIVDGTYATRTGTHSPTGLGQDVLNPDVLTGDTLDQLDMSVLFSPRDYFTVSDPDTATAVPGAGNRTVSPDGDATWYFGGDLEVRKLEVPDADARADSKSGLSFSLVGRDHQLVATPAPRVAASGMLEIDFVHPRHALALVAHAGGSTRHLGSPSITTSSGVDYVADGQLESQVVPPHWSLEAVDGAFAVFDDRFAEPALRLRPLPGSRGLGGASVKALEGSSFSPSSAGVSSKGGVEVVRAVAAIPGWHATWSPEHGPTRSVAVRRSGLIQVVDVPAGSGVLRWAYDPPGWTAGWMSTLAAMVVLVVLLLVALGSRRRSSIANTTGVVSRC
jgi:hypothetical protein